MQFAIQRVLLKISATDNAPDQFVDDYICPLYVHTYLLPSNADLFDFSSGLATRNEKSAAAYDALRRLSGDGDGYILLTIPLVVYDEGAENSSIAMHSGPRWRLPFSKE
jgi:hypothetical protein